MCITLPDDHETHQFNHTLSNHTYELYREFDESLELPEYDSDDDVHFRWLLKLIPSVLVYGTTFILGFFGNLLVIIAILRFKKLQSVTNIFLISLATADFLLIIFCVPFKVITIILFCSHFITISY
jgi:hypothetical protein